MNDTTATKPLWRKIIDFPLVALVIGIFAIVFTLGLVGRFVVPFVTEPFAEDTGRAMSVVIAIIAVFVIYKLVLPRIGDDRQDDLPKAGALGDLGRGTMLAAILMTLMVAVAWILGVYDIQGWGGSTSFLMILFSAGFQAAFIEEVLFRGVIFRFLEQFGGSWFALAISSALFGYAHISNDNATVFSSIAIAVEAGILLGGAYMLTRSLWFAIGIHFGWNVVQGYVWDVPVSGNAVDGLVESSVSGPEWLSGGAFGLEASIIALIAATVTGVYLVWLAAQRGQVIRPWWTRRRLAKERAAIAG